uniref:Uncharacterized protein n=1 Tax=Anguilla anguilla TaxID=7936 RepID=A0A0E9P7M5_ANGAN
MYFTVFFFFFCYISVCNKYGKSLYLLNAEFTTMMERVQYWAL